MKNRNQKNNPILLIPIAMMFTTIGITMSIQWLKFSFLIISVILCVISLLLSLRNNNNDKNK